MRSLRTVSILAILLTPVLLAGGAPRARAQFSAPKFLKATAAAPKNIEPGKAFVLAITVTIDKPYHIQANPAKENYIPTELAMGPVKGFKLGKVTYPKATQAEIGGETLPIYEGKVEIKAEVTPGKVVKPGKFTLPVTLKYQGCNEQVCYPPSTTALEAPVTVGKGAAPKATGGGHGAKMAGGKTK